MKQLSLGTLDGIKVIRVVLFLVVCGVGHVFFLSEFNATNVAILSFILLATSLWLIYSLSNRRRKTYFVLIFLALLWMFHCGHLINSGFNLPYPNHLNYEWYGDDAVILFSYKYFFWFYVLLVVSCFASLAETPNYEVSILSKKINLYRIGFFLLLIGLFPRLYIDISVIKAGLSYGYKAIRELDISHSVRSFATFFDVAMLCFLVSKEFHNRRRLFLLIVVLYKLSVIIVGERQEAVSFLICFLSIYFFEIEKIGKLKVLLLLALSVVCLYVLNSIAEVRESVFFSIGMLFDKIFSIQNNDFIKILSRSFSEYGSAFSSLVVPVSRMPEDIGFGYGLSYLLSVFSPIPFVLRLIDDFQKILYYILFFNVPTFGGSMVGESYFNFGPFGLICAPFIGFLVAWCQKGINGFLDNPIRYLTSCVLAMGLILYIRGYFCGLVRQFVWICIAVWIYWKITLLLKSNLKHSRFPSVKGR